MRENYGLMFIKQHLGLVLWAGEGQFQTSSPAELSFPPEQELGPVVDVGDAVCGHIGEGWLVTACQ